MLDGLRKRHKWSFEYSTKCNIKQVPNKAFRAGTVQSPEGGMWGEKRIGSSLALCALIGSSGFHLHRPLSPSRHNAYRWGQKVVCSLPLCLRLYLKRAGSEVKTEFSFSSL